MWQDERTKGGDACERRERKEQAGTLKGDMNFKRERESARGERMD